MDTDQVIAILNANSKVPFVRRILSPFTAPVIKNGRDVMTHKMAWGESDGKFYVFPSIMESERGKLKDYGKTAFDEAIKRRDFITFDNQDDASAFSQNYKTYWDKIGFKP